MEQTIFYYRKYSELVTRNAQYRNICFPLVMAFAILLFGSFSTTLYFLSAAYLIFFNPASKPTRIFSESFALLNRFKTLYTFPLFFILVAFSSLVNPQMIEGLKMVGSYLQFLVLIPTAIGLVLLSRHVEFITIFIRGLRIVMPLALIFALFQVSVLGMRAETLSSNSLVFGTLCVGGAALALIRLPEDTALQFKFAIAAFACGAISAMLTASRAVLLTFIVLSCVQLWIFLYRSKNKIRILGVSFLLLMSLGVSIVSIIELSPSAKGYLLGRYRNPIQQIIKNGSFDASMNARVIMLKYGTQAFKQKPIIGYGLQNSHAMIEQQVYLDKGLEIGPDNRFVFRYSHLHNDFLTHATGGGIPLLLLFISALALPIVAAAKTVSLGANSHILNSGIILTTTFTVMSLTNLVFRHDLTMTFYSTVMLFIIAALYQASRGIETYEFDLREPDRLIAAHASKA